MTELLKLRLKAVRTFKRNSYRQENNIHEQMVKRTNEER